MTRTRTVILAGATALAGLFVAAPDTASAQWGYGRSGYYDRGGYGLHDDHGHGHHHRHFGYRVRPYRSWYHDTSHWDYHPGYLWRHGNHYHYEPGHYHWHNDGHWHAR